VPRPLEWGPGGEAEPTDPTFSVVARDFLELAKKLGA
jgi:2-haloacid dehalogenase